MKILAIEREKADLTTADFAPFLHEEARSAWRLYQSGIIRELYFNPEAHTAVLMLECDSPESAREVLAGLPLVHEGLIEFDLIPLAPYDGFERLFGLAKSEQTA